MSNRTVKEIVNDMHHVAVALGWEPTNVGTKAVTYRSSTHPNVNITIPREDHIDKSYSSEQLRSMVRRLWRYADPLRCAAWTGSSNSTAFMQFVSRVKLPLLPTRQEESVTSVTAAADQDEVSEDQHQKEESTVNEPTPTPPRHLIQETPWLARRGSKSTGGGRRYPSSTVTQRHWSDGTIDYACSFPGCGYEHDNPISVARHYGRTQDHQHGIKPSDLVFDPNYEPTGRTNRQQRIDKMATRIQRALAVIPGWQEMDPDALGCRLADMLTPESESVDESSGTPLTDGQLIEKIRHLLDRGEYIKQQDQITDLTMKVEELEKKNETSSALRQQAVDRLRAYHDLISGDDLQDLLGD